MRGVGSSSTSGRASASVDATTTSQPLRVRIDLSAAALAASSSMIATRPPGRAAAACTVVLAGEVEVGDGDCGIGVVGLDGGPIVLHLRPRGSPPPVARGIVLDPRYQGTNDCGCRQSGAGTRRSIPFAIDRSCGYRRSALKPTPEQFEALALEQLDTLYRVARRITRDAGRAEDLVQETYVRALRARDSFDLQSHGIRPWLLRIMHNVHVSRAEREGRQPTAIEDEQLEAAAKAQTPPLIDPASFEGMDEQLVRAIEGLAEEYQVVLILWAVEELSYKEIAEAVDIPIGTVMSRLYRARQRLSEQLRSFAVNEGIIRE